MITMEVLQIVKYPIPSLEKSLSIIHNVNTDRRI